MEVILIVLIILVIIGCFLTILYASTYNKFQDYIIRIDETESIIDKDLRKKYDIFNKLIPVIKTNTKNDNIFKEIIKLKSRKIGSFDLYRYLINAENEFALLKEKNKKLKDNKDIKNLEEEIKEINTKLDNEIDYLNDNISNYNFLLKKFPSNIISNICNYKEKLYFDRKNMKDEDYNDFKL